MVAQRLKQFYYASLSVDDQDVGMRYACSLQDNKQRHDHKPTPATADRRTNRLRHLWVGVDLVAVGVVLEHHEAWTPAMQRRLAGTDQVLQPRVDLNDTLTARRAFVCGYTMLYVDECLLSVGCVHLLCVYDGNFG